MFLFQYSSLCHQTWQVVCPSRRAYYSSFIKGILYVPQKGHLIYSPKRSYCLSLQSTCYLSPQKDMLFVPQKGNLTCPSKRAPYVSLKRAHLCPSERAYVIRPLNLSVTVTEDLEGKGRITCPFWGTQMCPFEGQIRCPFWGTNNVSSLTQRSSETE